MLFNTVEFFLFLAIVLVAYHHVQHKTQNRLLLVASYVFYSFWDVRFLFLIAVSTGVDYLAGHYIVQGRKQKQPRLMRVALLCSLLTNLGILAFFKYYNFFVESAVELIGVFGVNTSYSTLEIILPVGISFYTFQTLSYTIDIYRGRLEPITDFFDFALFVSFFPQLVAGPIERAATLIPQIERSRLVTNQDIREGIYLILVGLMRKVVIADTAGLIADRYFSNPAGSTSLQLIVGMLLYSLQIYGDFAGYSNIARGTSRLLGIRLMRNFQHPYFAANVSDFWRRWHISLSTWLRDYLYISLGGNRKGAWRTRVNLMLTMLLGGLWHGASMNFVIWGGVHGAYLVVNHYFRQRGASNKRQPGLVRQAAAMIGTYLLVAFTWLFFRLPTTEAVWVYLNGMAQLNLDGQLLVFPLLILFLLMLVIDVPQAWTEDEFCFLRMPMIARAGIAAIVLMFVTFSAGGELAPFIYFQF